MVAVHTGYTEYRIGREQWPTLHSTGCRVFDFALYTLPENGTDIHREHKLLKQLKEAIKHTRSAML